MRVLGERAPRRQMMAVTLAAVLIAGIAVATLAGTREPADAVNLLRGDAWLVNQLTGSTTHVDGYAKRADATAGVVRPGDPFVIVQRPDGAYVLDERTGVLSRVGDDQLGVSDSRQLPGQPSAIRVSTGGSTTWDVDTASGIAQQVNPTTLAPAGPQIPLGGPVDSVVTDNSGTLWASLPHAGTVAQVAPGGQAVQTQRVGEPGDSVQLAVTGDGTWAVDPQAGQARSLNDPGLPVVALPQSPVGAPPLVVAGSAGPDLVVVTGPTVHDIDTASATASTVTSGAYTSVTQAVVNDGEAYLLQPSSSQLIVLGLGPVHQLIQEAVPPGSDQLLANNDLVFVNNPTSPAAAVVNADGQVTPLTKYQPPTSSGPANPDVLAPPAPSSGSSSAVIPNLPVAPAGLVPTPSALPTLPALPAAPIAPPTTVAGPVRPVHAPKVPPPPPPAPGAPTVTQVAAGAGTFGVRWSAGPGPAPTSFTVLLIPQSGGAAVRHQAPAGARSYAAAGLARGVTYCARVQAVGASGGGPLSAPSANDCASTIPNAPTAAPASLSYVPGHNLVDISFTAAPGAPAGTTYSIELNGQLAQSRVGPGTYAVPLAAPTPANVNSTSATASVFATNAGGQGPSTSATVWSYAVINVVTCLEPSGYNYELGGTASTCTQSTSRATVAPEPFAVIPTPPTSVSVPLGAGDEVECQYDSSYNYADNSELYQVTTATTCPAAPSGYHSAFHEVVWAAPGSTHTVPITEYRGTVAASGKTDYVMVGPGQSPSSVAGETLTSTQAIASWYDDKLP